MGCATRDKKQYHTNVVESCESGCELRVCAGTPAGTLDKSPCHTNWPRSQAHTQDASLLFFSNPKYEDVLVLKKLETEKLEEIGSRKT